MAKINPKARTFAANNWANALLLLFSAVFLIWAYRFIEATSFIAINGERHYALFDDAMISMRYAWNFAHGNGLVWNAGEPVEGYTNLLMVLVMAVPNALLPQRFAVLAVQIFGVLTMLGVAYLTSRIVILLVPEQRFQRILRVASFVAVLLYYPLVYWTLMGMETGLVTFLLLAAVFMLLTYQETRDPRRAYAMALLLGLSYLTRPESAILSGLILLYYFYITYRKAPAQLKLPWRALMVVGALFVVLPLAQHFYRWWYYGELFSNTYTLKAEGLPLGERIGYGLDYTWPFLKDHALLLLIAFAGVVRFLNIERLLVVVMVAVMIAYQIFIGGEPIEWTYWRVVAPVMPLLLALAGGTLVLFCAMKPSRLIFGLAVLVGAVALIQPLIRYREEQTLEIPPYQTQLNAINVNKALLIADITTEDASLGVSWGGTVPYYNPENYTIDYLGKSDPIIARLAPYPNDPMRSWPGHNKHDLTYSIQTLQPTFSETFSYTVEDVGDWARRHYAAFVVDQDIILYFKLDDLTVDLEKAFELGLFPWLQWNVDALLVDWAATLDTNAQSFMPANSYGIVSPVPVVSPDQLAADNANVVPEWQSSLQPEPLRDAGITHLLVDSGWWHNLTDVQRQIMDDPATYELVHEFRVHTVFLRFYQIVPQDSQ